MFNGILIRYGETFLKKGRRRFFLDVLRGNIERAIGRYEDLKLIEFHGYFLIVNSEQRSGFYPEMAGIEERLSLLKNIFGVSSYMPVAVASLKEPLEEIFSRGLSLVRQSLTEKTKTFRIDSSRSYKNFPLDSMEINREAGAYIQSATGLGVNLTSPDITLFINISKDMALLYTNVFRGAGGLPLGSSGRALLMLSGGIDSPVAGWLSMKRGLKIDAVYFHSAPFIKEKAKEKVVSLAKILAGFQSGMRLYVVPFAAIQHELKDNAPGRMLVVLYRRFMLRIAGKITERDGYDAIVTGDSIGQVASQTIVNMDTISSAVKKLIIRPLATYDKEETISIAKRIGTFEVSIQPFEDCCSLFVPPHPETAASIPAVEKIEEKLRVDALVNIALDQMEIIEFN